MRISQTESSLRYFAPPVGRQWGKVEDYGAPNGWIPAVVDKNPYVLEVAPHVPVSTRPLPLVVLVLSTNPRQSANVRFFEDQTKGSGKVHGKIQRQVTVLLLGARRNQGLEGEVKRKKSHIRIIGYELSSLPESVVFLDQMAEASTPMFAC
ncbi:hypothetical protein MG293_003552 [Ovis ammon polii]|uniref:Uncharacterized protein n=1 Tax=Ovis ammon polii TaxID=230172 RepID=A0AAD4ULT9_OVIAM|nr:hypothetical protein MG293_003552 [Ovis ammon polii]